MLLDRFVNSFSSMGNDDVYDDYDDPDYVVDEEPANTKKEAAPVKAELLEIIHEVQDIVRDDFTFQYTFIGSSSRNMITEDIKSNIGYDFDVNLEVNDDEENSN